MTASSPEEIPGYRFVRPIGSGGYADVYLYRELSPARDVAVKILKAGLGEQVRRQFTDEANAIAELGDHPHIVTVFAAADTPDGRPYMAMSYCPQDNYLERARRQRFTVNEVLTIGLQVASAVAAVHEADILHRDIKPANILTDQRGRPRLADFGIASRTANARTTDEVAMSVPWAPPEVLRGEGADVRSDVYSLGATLWHLLVGHSPFWVPSRDDTVEAMISRIVDTPLPPLGRADVPPEFEHVLRQAMAPQARDRQRTASVLGAQLQELKRQRGLDHVEVEFRTSVPDALPPMPPRVPDSGHTQVRGPRPPAPEPGPPPAPAPVLAGHTVRRSVPADEPVANTRHRPPDTESEPAAPAPHRRWPALVLASGVLAAVVAVGVFVLGGDPPADGARNDTGTQVTDPAGAMQDAGLPGGDTPPGRPTVTATRAADGSVRFAWTYSAPLATDTFSWQTSDVAQAGVAKTPELVLPGTAGTALCLQIKVVRADGSHATADWSDAGCAN